MKEKLTHITGLRGLAIILIMTFHICNNACICGHFGVDVFLVISGYMIFRGLIIDNKEGKINVAKYYKKRFCRIYPTLIGLLMLCLPFVLYFTIYSTRIEYAETGIASLLGFANKYLESNSPGYFQNDNANNPLLHLWYLSVIIQVYLAIPIIVIVTHNLKSVIQRIIWVMIFIASALIYHHEPIFGEKTSTMVTSIVDTVYQILGTFTGQEFWQSFSSPYYWTSGRLWEILAGGAILFMPDASKNRKTLLVALGIVMILIPSFTFQKGCLFSLPVVLGSVLIIKYCRGTGIDAVFSNKIIVAVGAISYSLYLVHWPIYSIIKQYSPDYIEELHGVITVGALSLGTAILVYKYVEKIKVNLYWTLGCWFVCIAILFAFKEHGGQNWTIPGVRPQIEMPRYREAKILKTSSELDDFPEDIPLFKDFYGGGINSNSMFDNQYDKPLLKLGNNNLPPKFILIGDSHANSLVPAFDLFCNETNNSGAFVRAYFYPFMGTEWCKGYEKWGMHITADRTELFLQWLENTQISHVIICVHWDSVISQYLSDHKVQSMKHVEAIKQFEEMLADTCMRLRAKGKMVAFVTPVTLLGLHIKLSICDYINTNLLHGADINNNQLSLHETSYKERFKDVLTVLKHLEERGMCDVVHQEASLFVDGEFNAYSNGKILMSDNSHLSYDGAIRSYKGMKTSIAKFLIRQPK